MGRGKGRFDVGGFVHRLGFFNFCAWVAFGRLVSVIVGWNKSRLAHGGFW